MKHASINRVYRLVFNALTGTYVVAPECARRGGKSPSMKVLLTALLGSTAALQAMAQIAPVSGTLTNVYNAPNGVPVVNINKADANGLSHNQYNQYNVDARGVVLNNGNTSQVSRTSQLAGQVIANRNLVNEARVILNEVVAPNRSNMAGFTEVLGGKADVIVANPYGITCTGCGFINTDRVILTTGVPTFDAARLLKGFAVSQGDILINGDGLNGKNQTLMELVTRSLKLEGQVNTPGTLNVVTGVNNWGLDGSVVKQTPGATAGTTYAIDTSSLGGMYAGMISVVSTEAGMGVRMAGDMAASAGSVTITAEGKITATGNTSATADVSASSRTAQSLSGNITAQNVTLNSTGDLALGAGNITAKQALQVSAASLNDAGNTGANRATRFGQSTTLSITGNADMANAQWGAQGNTTTQVGGALNLTDASVYANGNLSIHASSAALNGTSDWSATGTNTSTVTGALAVAAGSSVQSTSSLVLNTGSTTNSGTLQGKSVNITGSLTNNASGTIASETDLSLGGSQLSNAGKVAASQLTVTSTNVGNTGTLQGKTIVLSQAQSLTNSGTIAATGTGASLSATAQSITNQASGKMGSDGSTTLVGSTSVSNAGQLTGNTITATGSSLSNSGLVAATQALSLGNGGTASLSNLTGGALQGASVSATSQAITNNGKVLATGEVSLTSSQTTLANQAQGTVQGASVNLTGGLNNDGLIKATSSTGKVSTLSTNKALTNSSTGKIESAGQVRLLGTQLTNQGSITSDGNITLGDASRNLASLSNTGKVISDKGSLVATLGNGTVSNNGTLQAHGDLSLDSTADLTLDAGLVASTTGATTVSTAGTGVLNAGASVQGAKAVSVTSANSLTIQSGAGVTSSTDATTVKSTNSNLALNGAVSAATQAKAQALNLVQVASTGALTGGSVVVQASQLSNDGKLAATSAVDLSNTSTTNRGLIQAQGGSSKVATLTNESTGKLVVADVQFGLNGGALNNQGRITSTGNISGTVSSLQNGGASNSSAALVSTGTLALTTQQSFTNFGAMHATGDFTLNSAGSITNSTTGGISGGAKVALGTSSNFTNAGAGAVYAAGLLTVNAAQGLSNESAATISSDGGMALNGANIVNNGAITSNGNINITATVSFKNETLFNGSTISKTWVSDNNWNFQESTLATEGSFDSGMNAYLRTYTGTEHEELVGVTNTQLQSAVKAQIVGTGTLSSVTIDYAGSGVNNLGTITAPTVNVGGNGTFTNQDMSLLNRKVTKLILLINDEGSFKDYRKLYAKTDPAGGFNRPGDESSEDYNPGSAWRETYNRGSFWGNGDIANALNQAGGATSDVTTGQQFNAGIKAVNFNFTRGTLNNVSSPYTTDATKVNNPSAGSTASVKAGNASGDASQSVSGWQAQALASAGFSNAAGATAAAPMTVLNFGGVSFRLPTNPNGMFVVAKDPKAGYLIETNPQFGLGADFAGSNYMAQRYGYNPDTIIKRLGDANYEAYVIRQQIINATGSALLGASKNEAAQLQALMDNALEQGKALGLTYGKAPTAAQLAKLGKDIVWMEEVEVNGQKVLAPRVYLAKATVEAAVSGAAIVASGKASIQGEALSNTGGTIQAKNLDIKVGNVTNTSGTIDGVEKASITATKGSIVNTTLSQTSGNAADVQKTTIGKTGSIGSSQGDLSMKAAKDIVVTGAKVTAKGNADIEAAGKVTFDTIKDKSASFDKSGNHTSSEKNVGSGLDVGGNLAMKSKGDVTIAGSNVDVKGNASIKSTEGSLKVIDRVDVVKTESAITRKESFGGGSIYSKETSQTKTETGTSKGSSVKIGGTATLAAKDDITLQGSEVKSKGKLTADATNINVLAGTNYSTRQTVTTKTEVGKVGADGESGAKSASGKGAASASANAKGDSSAKLIEVSTSTRTQKSTTGTASSLSSESDMSLTAKDTVKVVGSQVKAGGDLAVDAKNVTVTTFKNVSEDTTNTRTISVGAFAEGESEASAEANKKSTSASANAKASGSGTVTVGTRDREESSSTTEITNLRSGLSSGGNMSIKAKETASFHGADVKSEGDMSIAARNITNTAAKDEKIERTSSKQTTDGYYAGAKSEASANAGAGQGQGAYGANAKGEASAEVSAGKRLATESETKVSGSTTMAGSTFTSGGNMTRKATETLSDQGTQLDVTGNLTQSAKRIVETRAENTTYESTSKSSLDARIGVSAGADAKGDAQTGKADASASAGLKASLDEAGSKTSSSESKAVVSSYKVGGKLKSDSVEETKLLGTKITAGKGAEITGGSVDIQAAKDHKTETKTDHKNSGEIKVKLAGDVGAEAKFDHSEGGSQSSSTTATGASIAGGTGAVVIRARTGDVSLEGTEVSGASAQIKSDTGAVKLKAAQSTTSETSDKMNVGGSIAVGAKSLEAEGKYGNEKSSSSSTTNQAVSIKTTGGVDISAKKDVELHGTKVDAGGDVGITSTTGSVKAIAVQDTSTSSSSSLNVAAGFSAEGGGGGGKGGKGGSGSKGGKGSGGDEGSSGSASASLGMEKSNSSEVTNQVVNIKSGGRTTIDAAKDVKLEGTQVSADKGVAVSGASITKSAVKDSKTESSSSLNVDVAAAGSSGGSGGKADAGKKKPAAKPAASKAAPAKSSTAKPSSKGTAEGGVGAGGLSVGATSTASGGVTKTQGVNLGSQVQERIKP
jgi:filamentous hemagglutinin